MILKQSTSLSSVSRAYISDSSKSLCAMLQFYPENSRRLGEGGLRVRGQLKRTLPGKPLVSILVAVFNGAQYLEDTLKSVLAQSYDNIELIVIDGGSTDGTLDIIRRYEDAIDYWISEPDCGISDAFNKAVLLAAGDYLNFQGAGDCLVSDVVVAHVLSGVDPRRDMLISARVQRVKEHDPDHVVWVAPRRYKPKFNKHSLLFRMSLPHQGLLTNRRMFERWGLFDVNNKFCMDYEFLLRAYHDFPNIVMKDIVFSAWREGGIGFGRTSEILKEYAQVRKQNRVAPLALLELIDLWSKFKLYVKQAIGRDY